MRSWRLLRTDNKYNCYRKMATDEAILQAVALKKVPATLRFYTCAHPAVAIGYFQAIKEVLKMKSCQEDNIEIFRRMTGGGAVYKDPQGELNYSLIIPEDDPLLPKDIFKSYRQIELGVIKGLKRLGIKADFGGINDIMIAGKKISGNAQTRSGGAVLQHGTILLDFKPDLMLRYLKIPKIKRKAGTKVGTIKEFLPTLSIDKLQQEIINGFAEVFAADFKRGKLSNWEKEQIKNLNDNKYSRKEWIYLR